MKTMSILKKAVSWFGGRRHGRGFLPRGGWSTLTHGGPPIRRFIIALRTRKPRRGRRHHHGRVLARTPHSLSDGGRRRRDMGTGVSPSPTTFLRAVITQDAFVQVGDFVRAAGFVSRRDPEISLGLSNLLLPTALEHIGGMAGASARWGEEWTPGALESHERKSRRGRRNADGIFRLWSISPGATAATLSLSALSLPKKAGRSPIPSPPRGRIAL